MANRTQLRIGQITGSFDAGPGGIVDNLTADSAANIGDITLSSGSLVGVLSEMASAIKRINGGNTFAALDAGEIAQNVSIIGTTPTLTIGDNGNEDVKLKFNSGGTDFQIGVDHDENGILRISTSDFDGTAEVAELSAADNLFVGNVNTEGNIGGVSDESKTIFAESTSAGSTITLGGGGLVITAGDLQVNGGDIDVNSAKALNIGATVGANAITLGAATSEVVVPGSLIVQGASTTLTSSNTVIQDAIIGIGVSGSEGYAPAAVPRGIVFGAGAVSAFQQVLYHGGSSDDRFHFGLSNTSPTSSSFVAPTLTNYAEVRVGKVSFANDDDFVDISTGELTIQGSDKLNLTTLDNTDIIMTPHGNGDVVLSDTTKLEFNAAGSGEHIVGDGSNLTIASGQDILIDAERDIVLDTNGDSVTIKNNGTTFGNIKASTNSLVLSGGNGTGKGIFIDSHAGTVTFREGSTSSVIGVLEANSAGLVLSASAEKGGTLTLDPNDGNLNLSTQGTLFGQIIKHDTAGVILSSSVSLDLVLDSSSGIVNFAKNNNTTTRAAIDMGSVTNEISFGHFNASAASFDVGYLQLKKTARSFISASSGLDIDAGADAAELRLIATGTFGDFVGLKSPATLAGGSLTFTLPSADASSSGQALVSNGSGTLSFSAVGGAATKKGVRIIGAAGIASGSAVSMATANLAEGSQPGTLISTAYDRVDVFVNGLLMMSGTDANVGTGVRDYTVSASRTIKFGFDLEADDIVTIIEK